MRLTVCLLFSLALLLPLPQCHATLVMQMETTSRLKSLSLAMAQVLQQSEMSHSQTLYVHLKYSSLTARSPLLELLGGVLMALPAAAPQPRYLFQQRVLSYRPYRHAVLLLVEDLRALQRLYEQLGATSDLSYTLIYMLDPQPELVMKLLWNRSVLKAGLLVFDGQDLLLLSYFPYSANHGCRRVRASVVNRFDGKLGAWELDEYFPAKLDNFFGCTLTCATWPDMPYLVRRDDGTFLGIEGELLQFMADNLNFSVGLYWLNESQVRETFDESGWVFEKIFSKAEYALGGFHYKPNERDEVPYSQSRYYFMSHIMLVTNLPSAYSAYEKLAFPFDPALWRAIALVLALGYFVVWLLNRFAKKMPQHPYYQLLLLTIGGNLLSRQLPQRVSLRLLLVTWLLCTLVIRSAYQSGMYQMLRQDRQRNPPQTIAEVLAQRYTVQLAPGNAQRWMESLPELKDREPPQELETSELQSFAGLAALSGSDKRVAIITPYEYFGYFRKVHAMSRRLHLVRERIFTQQLAFNVRRHSHLVGVLNKQIMQAHSHGFLEHWTRQYVSAVDESEQSIARIPAVPYETLNGYQPEGEIEQREDEAVQAKLLVLSFKELAALFWLTLWALLGSVLVFGLELLLHK
ncbi:PREDICTED: uncharacterized protein LOC108620111 [Drosophila arizonae]|uniref:Uncharacterized protein LOC108620111 n=1 Tax=Drosophila arizonae TaxID=7263 RepID=A0ABM1PZ43_DROAR|nr:PREDICTED: uncharacterized protein LOC108620111 [Drosophila arizonae]